MTLHPIPTDRDAWLALRSTNVGASEVAALFGAQPEYAPGLFALWQVKAGRIPAEQVDNPRVRWGLLLEDTIAAAAAEQEGWDVRPGMFAVSDRVKGMSATLDRIIAAPTEADRAAGCEGPGVLELKNVDWLTHRAKWGAEPPPHILLQLQAQLACTGYAWGAFAALVGGNDLRIYRYHARPKLIAEIERRVAAFWDSIRRNQVPNADGSDSTFRALRELNPEPVDECADLTDDAEAAVLCAEIERQGRARREAERAEAEAKARLLQKLGNHRWAKVPGWKVSQAITPAKPDRAAEPGEIIKGRAESRRLIVKEHEGADA